VLHRAGGLGLGQQHLMVSRGGYTKPFCRLSSGIMLGSAAAAACGREYTPSNTGLSMLIAVGSKFADTKEHRTMLQVRTMIMPSDTAPVSARCAPNARPAHKFW
jgi:hypothetical protein